MSPLLRLTAADRARQRAGNGSLPVMPSELGTFGFLVAVAAAAVIATLVFAHASRHGSRHPTAWGSAAFLFAGIVVPVYFLRYWLRRGRR